MRMLFLEAVRPVPVTQADIAPQDLLRSFGCGGIQLEAVNIGRVHFEKTAFENVWLWSWTTLSTDGTETNYCCCHLPWCSYTGAIDTNKYVTTSAYSCNGLDQEYMPIGFSHPNGA